MPFIAIALLLAVAVSGGVSLAAQHSLPGDPLWGVKVHINEGLQSALAAEGRAQAEFDISAIEARLDEAAELAADARLDANVQAKIESNFEGHARSVEEQVAKLEAAGDYAAAAEVAARFQAAVAGQASVLAEARATASVATQQLVSGIIGKVQATLDTASNLSAQTSANAAAHVNADVQVGL